MCLIHMRWTHHQYLKIIAPCWDFKVNTKLVSALLLLHYEYELRTAKTISVSTTLSKWQRHCTECKYKKYIEAQAEEIRALQADSAVPLPPTLWPCIDADWARGLKLEVREKLDSGRPATLGDASRLEGVTPAALVAVRLRARTEAAAGRAAERRQQSAV